eukprot:m51a1_g22 putative e3 ubiquitin-protein ligase ubr2-like (1582) ;mRNA; f:95281-100992
MWSRVRQPTPTQPAGPPSDGECRAAAAALQGLPRDELCAALDGLVRRESPGRAGALLRWALCAASDPAARLAQCAAVAQPKVCTAVWSGGNYFYRCRTCECSPASSVCTACFKNGNHEGHDYVFEVSNFGGTCDCGNSAAWKDSGFCCNHGKEPTGDPIAALPPDMATTAPAVLLCVSRYTVELLGQDSAREAAHELVNWLRSVGKVEILLRIMRKIFGKGIWNYGALFGALCAVLPTLGGKCLEDTLLLVLDLIQDVSTKLDFAPHFTRLYDQVFADVTEDRMSIIYRISPQVMYIPDVLREVIFTPPGTEGFLDMYFRGLGRLVGRSLDCGGRGVRDNFDRVLVFVGDMNTVMESPDIARQLAERSRAQGPALFRQWLSVLALLQGYDAAKRVVGMHVEYDDPSILDSFTFEIELCRCAPAVAACSGDLRALAAEALGPLCAWLRTWESGPGAVDLARPRAVAGVQVQARETGKCPVSLDLPLHRAVAYVLAALLEQDPAADLRAVVRAAVPEEFRDRLGAVFDHVVELQAWNAQVSESLWIRNGRSMLIKGAMYRVNPEPNAADLFLLQAAAVVMGADEFVATLLQRFGLEHVVNGGAPAGALSGASPQQAAGVASKFLGTLIAVVRSRCMTPPREPAASSLRRDILHYLAEADRTHSRINKHVAPLVHHKTQLRSAVDGIVEQLATETRPTPSKPALLRLRPELWAEFDPWYRNYEEASLQQALERFYKERKKATDAPPLWSGWKLGEVRGTMGAVVGVLHCEATLRVLEALARDAIVQGSDMALSGLVHLAWLMAENPAPARSAALDGFAAALAQLHAHPPAVLAQNEPLRSSLAALLAALSRVVAPGVVLSPEPTASAAASAATGRPGDGEQPSAADRKAHAQRRQREIMERMRKQQLAFLEHQAASSGGGGGQGPAPMDDGRAGAAVDEADEEDSGAVCILCRQEATESNAVGYIARAQVSALPWVAKRKACCRSPALSEGEVSEGQWTRLPARASRTEADPNWADGYWQDPNEGVAPELHNLEEGLSVHFAGCMHVLHVGCFERFFPTFVTHHVALGRSLSTEHGDFLCPTCRRIENVVVPVLPPDHPALSAALAVPAGPRWVQALRGAILARLEAAPATTPRAAADDADDLENRLVAVSRRATLSVVTRPANALDAEARAVVVANSIAGSVIGAEVALRKAARGGGEHWASQRKLLAALSRTALVRSAARPRVPHALLKLCRLMSLVPSVLDAGATDRAVVSTRSDIFSHYARVAFLLGPGFCRVGPSSALAALSAVAVAAAVTQALLHARCCVRSGAVAMPVAGDGDDAQALAKWYHQVDAISQSAQTSAYAVAVSAPLRQGLSLVQYVKAVLEPLLRRMALLHSVLQTTFAGGDGAADLSGCIGDGTDGILRALSLPSISSLWEGAASLFVPLPPSPASPCGFVPLPETFQDMVVALHERVCPQCGTHPRQSVFCLVCGAIECLPDPHCCRGPLNQGPLNHHALLCCGGVGVFILLEQTYTLAMRGHLRTVLPSLFLDKFGEEDPKLRRGKVLTLNRDRLAELETLWLTHSFEQSSRTSDEQRADLLQQL